MRAWGSEREMKRRHEKASFVRGLSHKPQVDTSKPKAAKTFGMMRTAYRYIWAQRLQRSSNDWRTYTTVERRQGPEALGVFAAMLSAE